MKKIFASSSEFGIYSAAAIAAVLEKHNIELVRNKFTGPLTEADFLGLPDDYGAIIVYSGHDAMSEKALQHFPQLKVIARHGIGYDAVDVAAAARRRVIVTNTQEGAHEERAVSDLAIGLLMAVVRNIVSFSLSTRAGEWRRPVSGDLHGRVLGIVGLGRIGRATAMKAKAFGLKVIAADPCIDLDFAAAHGIEAVDLAELLERADFISLHCPLTSKTKGLIGAPELSRMKDGAVLINCARGALVDETALYRALQSGKLAGAGLDVFVQEPPNNNSLLALPNVIATPHIAAYTTATINAMDLTVVEACVDVLTGKIPANIVNRRELAAYGLLV